MSFLQAPGTVKRESRVKLLHDAANALTLEEAAGVRLFEETFCVVTSADNPWARRRKVELAELMNGSWIFGEPSNAMQPMISGKFVEGSPPHAWAT